MDTDVFPEFFDADFVMLSAFAGLMLMIHSVVFVLLGRGLRRRKQVKTAGSTGDSGRNEVVPAFGFLRGPESSSTPHPLADRPWLSQLGEMSAAIAHELRQPLTAIVCTGQAAQRRLADSSACRREIAGMLGDITRAGDHASELIHRMYAMARREQISFCVLQLNDVVRDVLKLFNSDHALRDVALTVTLAEELPAVRGDPVQLAQVISNLVRNACDALADERLPRRTLTIRSYAISAEEVCVTVADSGPGLASTVQAKLFQPFETTKLNGTGLGLAISRHIVGEHLGRITGENNPDAGGALFTLTLPTADSRNGVERENHDDLGDDLCRG